MKKRVLFVLVLLMLVSNLMFAQQDKLLTHFIYDKMSINPAATGVNDGVTGTMIYRNQWDKVNGAPNSVLFNLESNLDEVFMGGAGMSFYHDAIGQMRQNTLLLNYSLPFNINFGGAHQGILNAGIGLGLLNIGFDHSWIPSSTLADPLLPASAKGSQFDLNFGLYWRGDKNPLRPYYVGLSTTHLTEPKIKNSINFNSARHYYLIGGYTMLNVLGEGKSLDFQLLSRTDAVKYSAELNTRYLHTLNAEKKTQVYAGLTYRLSDAVGLMLGYIKGPLTIGYSYDMTMNKLKDISKGSHEVVLRYVKMLPPPPVQKAKHPRWL